MYYVSHFKLVLLIRDKTVFIPKQYGLEIRRAHSQCSLKHALGSLACHALVTTITLSSDTNCPKVFFVNTFRFYSGKCCMKFAVNDVQHKEKIL